MKRFLLVFLAVYLICSSAFMPKIVLADEEEHDSSQETSVVLSKEAEEGSCIDIEADEDDAEKIVSAEIQETETSAENDVPVEIDADPLEYRTEDVSEYVIHSGGFESIEEISETSADAICSTLSTKEGFYDELLAALRNKKEEIDLSSYSLTSDELKVAFILVLNENPDLYYVESTFSYSCFNGYVLTCYFVYNDTKDDTGTYDSVVRGILSGVDPEWSDIEKAFYFHDWIVLNCQYDLTYSYYSSYDVFVRKTAVCQGYAEAFEELCDRAGLKCHTIISRNLNHAWNLVEIDGAYYYADCTWDDPIASGSSHLLPHRDSYSYFMCSRDLLYSKGHDTTDWFRYSAIEGAVNVYNGVTTSDKYDESFWRNVPRRQICLFENYALYYTFDSREVQMYDLKSETVFKRFEVKVDDGYGNIYDPLDYNSMIMIDSYPRAFINSNNKIIRLDLGSGECETVYSLTDEEAQLGNIVALEPKNGRIVYKIAQSDWDSDYAKIGVYSENMVAVSFDPANGEPINAVLVAEGSAVKMPEDPVRTGYTFDGWYLNGELFDLSTAVYDNFDLIAAWKENTYRVIYDANGGTGEMEDGLRLYSESYPLQENLFVRDNYEFVGWKDTNGNEISVIPEYTAEDVTVYAGWKGLPNTIVYDANGGTGGPGTEEKEFDSVYIISASLPEREGYEFVNWNSKADGTGETFKPGSKYKLNADLTLYAVWKAEKYTITYHLNGGSNPSGAAKTYTIEDENVLPIPSRSKFDFEGWYTTENFEEGTEISSNVGRLGNLDLYAKWIGAKNTITFACDDWKGNEPLSALIYTYETKGTVSLPVLNADGYSFYWATRALDSKGNYKYTKVASINRNANKDYDLYGVWTPVRYAIKYVLNGASNPKTNLTSYTVEEALELSAAVKKGYRFISWVDQYGEAISDTSGRLEDLVLTAEFKIETYQIVLDPDGGGLAAKQAYDSRAQRNEQTGLMEAEYDILSVAFKLPTLIKDGYKFKGWFNVATGKKVSSIAKGSIGNISLKAEFVPVTYKLSYNLNKGKIAKEAVYDKSFSVETEKISLPVPERKGYIFAGWYADKDFVSEVKTKEDLEYRNTTLYAKWEPITYKVMFEYTDADGNTERVVPEDDVFTYDVAKTIPAPLFASMAGKSVTKYSYVNDDLKTVSLSNLKIKNLTSVQDKTVVLVPTSFKYITYKVRYNLNGGKNVSANKTSYNVDQPIVLQEPVRKGYSFDGWYEDEGFAGEPVTSLKIGDHTLYAKWNKDVYTITYRGELGSFVSDNPNPESYSVDSAAIKLVNPSREGYKFAGWYKLTTDAKGNVKAAKITSIAKGSTGDIVLEARWTLNR